jgi:hypothetical protein
MDMDMASIELEKLLLHFCQCMRAEAKAPTTIIWYQEMVSRFIKFLKGKNLQPTLEEFTIELAREFIVYEQERKLSPYTVQAKVSRFSCETCG